MPILDVIDRLILALRDPRSAVHQAKFDLEWSRRYRKLRNPKAIGGVPHDSRTQSDIISQLKSSGFAVRTLSINPADYHRYVDQAGYAGFLNYYHAGKAPNFPEKSLEHYVSTLLLQPEPVDVYIDIANDHSPTPEIFQNLYGCTVYRQDLSFPEGIHGNMIGGDAGNIPLLDGSISKMALHCSLEHFEGEADIRFIREASRLLKSGGRLAIMPLYLHDRYAIQTDPMHIPEVGIGFDGDAVLYCCRNWGNRHGRFYDVPHLISRIRQNLREMAITIYVIENEKQIDASCYIKFAALLERV